jgi:hypothetical protein
MKKEQFMRFATISLCSWATLLITAGPVAAAAITATPGAYTYTYNAGSDSSDTNATTSPSISYSVESVGSGNAAYYNTTANGGVGTVSYTFNAPAGYTFTGNATEIETSAIVANPSGTIAHEVSIDGGSFTTIATDTDTDSGFDTTRVANSFSVAGATTFTLDYVLTNPSSNAILTQLFRETNGTSSAPFEVTATVTLTPEPASLVALVGLGGMGLLGFVLRRRRRNG